MSAPTSPRAEAITKAIDHGITKPSGIRAASTPDDYTGVWMGVVRDLNGAPIVAFDGMGRVVFLSDDAYLTEHDAGQHAVSADVIHRVLHS